MALVLSGVLCLQGCRCYCPLIQSGTNLRASKTCTGRASNSGACFLGTWIPVAFWRLLKTLPFSRLFAILRSSVHASPRRRTPPLAPSRARYKLLSINRAPPPPPTPQNSLFSPFLSSLLFCPFFPSCECDCVSNEYASSCLSFSCEDTASECYEEPGPSPAPVVPVEEEELEEDSAVPLSRPVTLAAIAAAACGGALAAALGW